MGGNDARSGNDAAFIKRALEIANEHLPEGWRTELLSLAPSKRVDVDATIRIIGPDGRRATLYVEAKRAITPREVEVLVPRLRQLTGDKPLVLVAPFMSPAVRAKLAAERVGYIDLAGNMRIDLRSPGLYIERDVADENPQPSHQQSRSLRGQKAARIVRSLLDFRRPAGVRELATRTGTDAGYVSKLLAFLDSEALVRRDETGRLVHVAWQELLRRWAIDAPLESRGDARMFLALRGIKAVTFQLGAMSRTHALTGSLAAARFAPVAPGRLLQVYVDEELELMAIDLGLRRANAGANVQLIRPRDSYVFERSEITNEGVVVAPSQAAADLLTSPGRGPAEADALIEWMASNEEKWRGSSLGGPSPARDERATPA